MWVDLLACLRSLNVAHNSIKCFPDCLSNLSDLEVMDASHNPLQDSSLAVTSLPVSIRFLDLSSTPITTLPCNIYLLSRLEHVRIDFTNLPSVYRLLLPLSRSSSRDLVPSFSDSLRRGSPGKRLRVLVMGNPSSGKSRLMSSFIGSPIAHEVIFTETSQPTRPRYTNYSSCLIVIDSSSDVLKETLFAQLHYAVFHSGVRSVCCVISKVDLLDHKPQLHSLKDTILNLVAEWRRAKIDILKVAKSDVERLSLSVTTHKLHQYVLESNSEIKCALHHLKNSTFSCVSSSCISGEGLKELSGMLTRSYRQMSENEIIPESWIQVQDKCLELLSYRDYTVLGKYELDAFSSLLMIGQQKNNNLKDILRFLADVILVQRHTNPGEASFVLANHRWFEKQLEYLTSGNQSHTHACGLVDVNYFKRCIHSEAEIRLFVVLLVFLGLCYEHYLDPMNRIEDHVNKDKEVIVQDFLQGRCCLLLPWLLSDKETETENAMLKAFGESGNLITKITYTILGKMPFTLFQQLCIVVLGFPQTNCVYHWKRGIMVRCGEVAAAIEDVETSSPTEREICVSVGLSRQRSFTFLSQLWSLVSNIVEVLEQQLKAWNYIVAGRLCICNFCDSRDTGILGPFRLFHEPSVVGHRSYLVSTVDHREGIDIEGDVVAVFQYIHLSEGSSVSVSRLEGNLDDRGGISAPSISVSRLEGNLDRYLVRDGISAPSIPEIQSRNVTTDPPGRPPLYPHMKDEQKRLESFRRWPSYAAISAVSLAKCGFFYTSVRDQVMCYNCGVKLGLWKSSHDPMTRHKNMSPDCEITSQSRFASTFDSSTRAPSAIKPTREDRPEFPPMDFETSLSPSMRQSSTPEPITTGFGSLRGHSLTFATEEGRRATFDHRWPSSCPVRPFALARAGFFYAGHDDAVQCFSCNVVLRGWEEGDTAMDEHKRHSPYCPFINSFEDSSQPAYYLPQDVEPHSHPPQQRVDTAAYNDQEMQSVHRRLASFRFAHWLTIVSIRAEDMASAGLYSVRGEKVRCFNCHVVIADWVPRDVPIEEHLRLSPHCSFARMVAQTMRASQAETNVSATAERMSDYRTRLASFSNWPRSAPVAPQELAAAGFYSTGDGDRVRCFSCGGALKDWQYGDTPWGEHGRFFPRCDFFQKNAPSNEVVTAAGYDEPWSHGEPVESSSLIIRQGDEPPWNLPAESTGQASLRPFSAVRSQPPSEPGVNQDFLDQAVRLGFDRGTAEKAIVLNMQLKGSPYRDVNDLIDDIIKAEREQIELKSTSFAAEAKMASEQPQATKKVEAQSSPLASIQEMLEGLRTAHGFSSKGKEKSVDVPSLMETGSIQSPVASLSGLSDTLSFQPTSHTLPLKEDEEEQLRELERRRTCKICLDREIAVVFLECGHVVCCDECSKKVFECPICRQPIKAKVRAFFS